jgi:hypothetical protein
MADNVDFTSGAPADFTASADDCSPNGKVQRVKLAYSADGAATHVPADADGLLVNLGANNDVTATQSGTWSVRLADGTGNALTSKTAGSDRAITVAVVDSSGNHVSSFGGSGGTAIADDAAFTAAVTNVTPVGGIVTSDSVDSGDAGAFAMLANRQQKVTLYDSAGVELAVGGGTQYDEDTAHVSGDKVNMAGVVRVDSAASLASADGDRTCLQVDSTGSLRVNVANTVTTTISSIAAGTNNIGDMDVLSVVPGTAATNLGKAEDAAHASGDTGVMALAVRTDTAAAGSGSTGDYEALHTDSAGALWARLVSELADDAAFTVGTSRVLPSGFLADETATDSVDEGDIAAARVTLDRRLIVIPQTYASGGWDTFRSLDLDESEEQVKATAGRVGRVIFTNVSGVTLWLKLYNDTAANVTVGTTTPQITIGLPGNATDDISGSIELDAQFTTAITAAVTTGAADNNTGAPAANDCVVNILYK